MKIWKYGLVALGLCVAASGCGMQTIQETSEEKKQVAMGRFMEETDEIQDMINNEELNPEEKGIHLWESREGKLEAIIKNDKFVTYEQGEDGKWTETKLGWCQSLNENYPEITEIAFFKEIKNLPNQYVFIGMTEDYDFYSGTISKDEIHFNDILKDRQYINIESIDIDDDGNLYMNNQDQNIVQKYNSEGEVVAEVNVKGYTISILGNKLAVLGFEGINIYNLEDFSLIKTIDSIHSTSSGNPIFNNGKDAFFVPLRKGLYRIDQSGEMVEQIIDGNLCSLASDWIEQAISYKDKFYMIFGDSLERKIKVNSYTYKADEPSVPDKELVIWEASGLSAVDDIANLYRQQHPDTYVRIEDIYDGTDDYYHNGSQIIAEDLDQLNTELLAGKGPDIIVLDALNYEKYQEQGMFEDLTSYINEWEEELPLLDNIVRGYQTQDAIYTIPLGFHLFRGIGEQELVKDGFEFGKLADYQEVSGDKILYPAEIEERSMVMLNACQEQLIQADGKINVQAVKDYLERCKNVSVKQQKMSTGFDWREGFDTESGCKEKVIKGDITTLESGYDAQVLAWIEENVPNYVVTKTIEGKENIAEGRTLVAINKNSKNKEGAKEFLEMGLSEKIQERSLIWSLPVNKNCLQKEIFNKYNENLLDAGIMYTSTIKYEGNKLVYGDSIKFEYGYKDKMNEFIEDCGTAQIIKPIDENIRKIIYDEALAYGNDEKSLDQAVDTIEKKVNLYLSEQGN